MGLHESKEIYNLDLIELGGSLNAIYKNKPVEKIDKADDFSESQVKDTVWRAGELRLDPRSGGLWFADTKDGVEKFAWFVRHEKRQGKPYLINLKNPYLYKSGFWHGYIEDAESYGFVGGREALMRNLMRMGYDGIIIADDIWNDTGDEYQVYGKQYIVFDENDVKPA